MLCLSDHGCITNCQSTGGQHNVDDSIPGFTDLVLLPGSCDLIANTMPGTQENKLLAPLLSTMTLTKQDLILLGFRAPRIK